MADEMTEEHGSRRRRAPVGITLALLLCTSPLPFACSGRDDAGPEPERVRADEGGSRRDPDVLIITLDTARADRFFGPTASRVETPAVDAVGREGAVFLQAISPVPVTLPAHTSLFTGKYPEDTGVRSNGLFRLADEQTTLAELLREQGWSTAAFVGAAVLDGRYGLDQGFSHYDDRVDLTDAASRGGSYGQRRAESVVAAAVAWLESRPPGPSFVWVHLYDPHAPYLPPEPERTRYATSPYDGEIAYTDRAVGHLLDAYKRLARYEDAIVVITSDHGEGLGEHGEETHGVFTYDSTLRVPLVIKAPGVRAGTRVHAPASLVDLLPTLCELAKVPVPDGFAGSSLVGSMENPGGRGEGQFRYFETLYPLIHYGWSGYRGVRSADWKLIRGPRDELYDLRADSGEVHDVASREPERVEALVARLEEDHPDTDAPATAEIAPDPVTRRQLLALGYADSAAPRPDPSHAFPDPKDHIESQQEMSRAISLLLAGRGAEAVALAEGVVADEPGSALFARQLAHMYATTGRLEEALGQYDRVHAITPGDTDAWKSKAAILHRLGRDADAIAAYEKAIALDADDRASRHDRWGLMLEAGLAAEVLREARHRLARDLADGEALGAAMAAQSRQTGEDVGIAALEEALAVAPGDPTLSLQLGIRLDAAGDFRRAEELYRTGYDGSGSSREAASRLARLLVRTRRWADARPIVDAAIARDPTAELLLLRSEIEYKGGDASAAAETLRRVTRLAPERADVWQTLGDVLQRSGDDPGALAAYRAAVEGGADGRRLRDDMAAVQARLEDAGSAARARGRGAIPEAEAP